MMSTDPAGAGLLFIVPRDMTAASDMDCLPAQWEIQCERRARSRIALYANLARMFLDDSVRHREAQPRAAILAFFRSGLGREERIVNSMDVFRSDPRSCVRDPYAHYFAITGGDIQL